MSADINQLSVTVVKEKLDSRCDVESMDFKFPLSSIEELENFESELKAKEKQTKFVSFKVIIIFYIKNFYLKDSLITVNYALNRPISIFSWHIWKKLEEIQSMKTLKEFLGE